MLITPNWPTPARVRAAFTLRSGGVSQGPYESLNLGAHVADAPDAVLENRRRVRDRLDLPSEPVWLHQVHGTNVLSLTGQERSGALQRQSSLVDVASEAEGDRAPFSTADAAVTRDRGVVCAIQVADCMPVLFTDREGSVVGAAHAGWRGLAAGVLESTVRATGAAASHLQAWLGPAIGPDHFEVGEEVRTAFLTGDPGAASAFAANARGRWQCDLYALARRRLAALGVSEVCGGGWSTYGDPARFFSYRRDGVCGRMAALIWIEDRDR